MWLLERMWEGEWYLGDYELIPEEIEILGFKIGPHGRVPCHRVFDPILTAPQPRSIAEVDRFLGAFNFCSAHTTGRTAVARTYLTDATKYAS